MIATILKFKKRTLLAIPLDNGYVRIVGLNGNNYGSYSSIQSFKTITRRVTLKELKIDGSVRLITVENGKPDSFGKHQ